MEPTEWEDRWTGTRLTKQLVTARRHLRKLHQTQTESTVHTERTETGRAPIISPARLAEAYLLLQAVTLRHLSHL